MVALPIVLFIFISSNYRDGKLDDKILDILKGTENGLTAITNKKDSIPPAQANDLGLQFSGDHSQEPPPEESKKIIREKVVEEQTTKEQAPVPLYSLVKNVCEKGYIMDQNGVCQKAIASKNGKKFDSERRRKRFIEDTELMGQKNVKPFFEHYDKPLPYEKILKNWKKGEDVDCKKLYPGLNSDSVVGCKKSVPET